MGEGKSKKGGVESDRQNGVEGGCNSAHKLLGRQDALNNRTA